MSLVPHTLGCSVLPTESPAPAGDTTQPTTASRTGQTNTKLWRPTINIRPILLPPFRTKLTVWQKQSSDALQSQSRRLCATRRLADVSECSTRMSLSCLRQTAMVGTHDVVPRCEQTTSA